MGFITSALEARQQVLNRGDRLREAMERTAEIKAQRDEQKRQQDLYESQQRMKTLQEDASNISNWRDVTPDKIAGWQSGINKERGLQGLPPITSVADPRIESVMQDKAQVFQWAKDGIPFDFSWNYLENKYGGEYLLKDDFGMVSEIAASGGFQPAPAVSPDGKPVMPESVQGQPPGSHQSTQMGYTPSAQGEVAKPEPTAQPTAQPAPPRQIQMGASAKDNLRALYEQYQSGIDPNDIDNVSKALTNPFGIALLRNTAGGESKIHNIGKAMGMDDRLWSTDKEGYIAQVQGKADEMAQEQKKQKNAGALNSSFDKIFEAVEKQGDPVAITEAWYPVLQSNGYTNSKEVFLNYVTSLKSLTADQEADNALGAMNAEERAKHNRAMEKLTGRRLTEQERRNAVNELMGWDKIKISRYNSQLSAARNALSQTKWNVQSVQKAIEINSGLMERQSELQSWLTDDTLKPAAKQAFQDEFNMIQNVRGGLSSKAQTVPEVQSRMKSQGQSAQPVSASPKDAVHEMLANGYASDVIKATAVRARLNVSSAEIDRIIADWKKSNVFKEKGNDTVTVKVDKLAKKNGIEPLIAQLRAAKKSDADILRELEKRY